MRAVALLLLAACSARSAGPSNRGGADQPLPGSCVDPLVDATKRLKGTDSEVPGADTPQPNALADLDGDGRPEQAFSAGSPTITRTAVYVMRGTCGHYVGETFGPPQPETTRSHGLADLIAIDGTHCEGARCGCVPGRLMFRFDGTAYKQDEVASTPGSEKPCNDGVDP